MVEKSKDEKKDEKPVSDKKPSDQGPSDRKPPSNEKPSSGEKGPSKVPHAMGKEPKGIPGGLIAILVLLGAVVFGLLLRYHSCKGPPPAPNTAVTTATDDFFQAYQKSVDHLVSARDLFFQGRSLIGGKAETLPESPETAESRPKSPFFRSAENFALATENLDHAEKLFSPDTTSLNSDEDRCRENLVDAIKRYRDAVRIFNQYAKAQYEGEDTKSEKIALSDGAAKWEMAETLMSDLLRDGCKGRYFIWVQKQPPILRGAAFAGYRAFYGPKFEAQRADFSRFMNYSEDSVPPTPESYPTKIFYNRPPPPPTP